MYIVLILVSASSLPKSMKIQNKVNKSRCRILFDRLSCYWFGVHVHACWWKSLIAYRNFTVEGLYFYSYVLISLQRRSFHEMGCINCSRESTTTILDCNAELEGRGRMNAYMRILKKTRNNHYILYMFMSFNI